MPHLDELKAQYERLGQEIKKLESEEWPKKGEKYWFINDSSQVVWAAFHTDYDGARKDFLGIFRTQAEAEAKLAVVKATMSPTKRWVPEDGQKYWFVNSVGDVIYRYWFKDDVDVYCLATNNVHKTKEETEAYARLLTEYGKSIVK